MDSTKVQLKKEDMEKREKELVLKMSRRMSQLEDQLNDVQKRLSEAINAIAEKDQIIDNLKAQVTEEGIQKLNCNQIQPNTRNKLIVSENDERPTEIIKDYKKRKPKPDPQLMGKDIHARNVKKDPSSESGLNMKQKSGNTIDTNHTGNYFPKSEIREKIKEARRLTDMIEERMTKTKQTPSLASSKDTSNLDNLLEYVEDNISSYSSMEDADEVSQEMEQEYNRLAKQVSEMETFLADYGLIWVGDADIKNGDSYKKVQASIGFSPNFDKIIMVISELNDIVSSESQVDVNEKKGKFKKAEVLKLTLFSDGIQLEDNPFREYSSPSVQEFFHDLEDGYYPTELKDTYPDGVIFKVVDKRSATYEDYKRKKVEPFSGKGHKLGTAEKQKGSRGPTTQVQCHSLPDTEECSLNSGKEVIPTYAGPSGKKGKEIKTLAGNESKEETIGNEGKRENRIPGNINNQRETNQKHKDVSKTQILEKIEAIKSTDVSKNANEDTSVHTFEELDKSFTDVLQPSEKDSNNVSENPKTIDQNVTNNIEYSQIYSEEEIKGKEKDVSRPSNVETLSNINFRDNINITNITYNEAPTTIQDQNIQSINPQSNFPKYTEQRDILDTHQIDRSPAMKYNHEITPQRIYDQNILEENYEAASSADRSLLHIPQKSEYSEMYDENVKHIIEAIQKRTNISPKIPQINPDEEFEHFRFLGAKPKIDNESKEGIRSLNASPSLKIHEKLDSSTDLEQNLEGSNKEIVKKEPVIENGIQKINSENEVVLPQAMLSKEASNSSL